MTCIKHISILLLGAFAFTGCKKENTVKPLNFNNKLPVVNAGGDQVIFIPTDSVELIGSATDPDGTITSVKWIKTAGPTSFDILNPNDSVTKVKNLTAGEYKFEFTGTDNTGAMSKDIVIITVISTSNEPASQDYRSKQTGAWDDARSWEQYNGSHWVAASRAPYTIDGNITILDKHIITISSPVEIDQVVINEGGKLIIQSDVSLSDKFATTDNDYELINNGTLEWQNGQISLLGGYSIVTLVNNGNFIISGNNTTWSYWWDSEARILNNGTISKSSTGFTSLEYVHLITNSSRGIIQGIGTMSVSGDVTWLPDVFINHGTIAPGQPIGILKINRVLHPFSKNSVLNIEIKDNSGAGSGHDQLIFDKNVTLNGTLTVKEIGTIISNGKFTILSSSGTIDGNFNRINLPPGYTLQKNSNSLDLVKN